MQNKGFTLIELLVAMLIVAVLATYSVLAYTDTIYEGENKQAKSKLELIAGAYERYQMEFPSATLSGLMENPAPREACSSLGVASPKRLIACGFLARMDFANLKYNYYLGNARSGGIAYMQAKTGAKVGGKYSGTYCAYVGTRSGEAKDGTK